MSGSVSNEELKRIVKEFNIASQQKFGDNDEVAKKVAASLTAEENEVVTALLRVMESELQRTLQSDDKDITKFEDVVFLSILKLTDIFVGAATRVVGEAEMVKLIPEADRTEDISSAFDTLGAKALARLTAP